MKRSTPGLKLVQAVSGFVQYKAAEALSPRTLESYQDHLDRWQEYIGDVDVSRVSTQQVRAFLAWLRAEYKPRRLTGGDQPLSPKTIHNFWVTLSAFYRWASGEFGFPNPMTAVPAPKFEEAPVEPFAREEIEQLLKAVEYCREAKTDHRRAFCHPSGYSDSVGLGQVLQSPSAN